jgi:hypothetical protein
MPCVESAARSRATDTDPALRNARRMISQSPLQLQWASVAGGCVWRDNGVGARARQEAKAERFRGLFPRTIREYSLDNRVRLRVSCTPQSFVWVGEFSGCEAPCGVRNHIFRLWFYPGFPLLLSSPTQALVVRRPITATLRTKIRVARFALCHPSARHKTGFERIARCSHTHRQIARTSNCPHRRKEDQA